VPTYTFMHKDTGEVVDVFMSISEREAYLEMDSSWNPVPTSAVVIDPVRLGTKKPDQQFRERMTHIKEHHSRGVTKSTIHDR